MRAQRQADLVAQVAAAGRSSAEPLAVSVRQMNQACDSLRSERAQDGVRVPALKDLLERLPAQVSKCDTGAEGSDRQRTQRLRQKRKGGNKRVHSDRYRLTILEKIVAKSPRLTSSA